MQKRTVIALHLHLIYCVAHVRLMAAATAVMHRLTSCFEQHECKYLCAVMLEVILQTGNVLRLLGTVAGFCMLKAALLQRAFRLCDTLKASINLQTRTQDAVLATAFASSSTALHEA